MSLVFLIFLVVEGIYSCEFCVFFLHQLIRCNNGGSVAYCNAEFLELELLAADDRNVGSYVGPMVSVKKAAYGARIENEKISRGCETKTILH